MTNQRIRYQKTAQGVLQSRRYFLTKAGQEVYVQLDLNGKKYRILDSSSGVEVTSGGNTRNISVLKIQAKKGLTGLGVEFMEEKRDRSGATPTLTAGLKA